MRIPMFVTYLKKYNGILTVSIVLNSPLERLLMGFASDDDRDDASGVEITACSLYLLILELEVIFFQINRDA